MEGIPYLNELAVIAAVGVIVTVLLARLKLPTVAGLLAAGAIVGPYGLGLAKSPEAIELLANIGVVLLLFTIGLEYSLNRLGSLFKTVALGGALQVSLTTLFGVLVGYALGWSTAHSVVFGFVLALSSTAIVLRGLAERDELDVSHGKFIVGTLIFQDLCVVPMVLVVPLLASAPGSGEGSVPLQIGGAMLKAALVVGLTLFIAHILVPRALRLVVQSRSNEAFLLSVIAICIGTAWVTSLAGLSLALGAFLGGVVVADTEYRHRAMSEILPLRDIFVSLFFVSLGMLFNVEVVMGSIGLVVAYFLAFTLVKGLIAGVAATVVRMPPHAAWLAGVGLGQFGEFGFVLTKLAEDSNVMTSTETAPLLAAGIASMFVTPLLIRVAPHIHKAEMLLSPLHRVINRNGAPKEESTTDAPQKTEVLILGLGHTGLNIARSLIQLNHTVRAIELNLENVRTAKEEGLHVEYGDATSEQTLRGADAEQVNLVLVLLNDRLAAQRATNTLRRLAPNTLILTRAHYLYEREMLLELGASDVVTEESEAAVEVLIRCLRAVGEHRASIEREVPKIRELTNCEDNFRRPTQQRLGDAGTLDDLIVESAEVTESSYGVGNNAITLNLRARTGALMIGLKRAGRLMENPDPHQVFDVGDILFLVGDTRALAKAEHLIQHGPDEPFVEV